MTGLRWRWRAWRARRYVRAAYLCWRRWPSRRNGEALARAADLLAHVEAARP